MPRVATGESVIARAVRIFDVFSPSQPAVTITEIARRADLHIATTSRIVHELVENGLLARTGDGRVQIGIRMWELALRASPTLSLREVAMPFLEDVHDVVGHDVQLGVLDGTEVLFIERLSAPGAAINYSRIAGRLPAHASSSGLVLLAFAPADLQERVLAGPLQRFTPNTVTQPARLRALLADIRRERYVVTAGHVHPDAAGVAVPIEQDGTVVAALSAIVPNNGHATAVVPVLRTAARGIARGLRSGGYHYPGGKRGGNRPAGE